VSEPRHSKVLGEVADIKQGRYLAKEDMAAERSAKYPVPVHGANGIIGWTDRAMYPAGVPLVTCRGSNSGMVLWADGPLWVSNNAMAIIPFDGDLRFAYYCLLNSPPYETVSGSAQPQITRTALAPKRVLWPAEDIQRAISGALTALDDKIELNRRMNETLEAMAQAIFRDWFVDFGPVRRKLEGATDPVAIMGGLMPDPARAAELAGLFPGEFGDDELPLGWKAGNLGDLATTAGESVDPTRLTEDTPYIGLEHMPRRSIVLENWDYAGKVSSQKSRFSSGQVLFGKLRPYFHKVGIAPVDGVCSTDIVVLDSRTDYDRGLVACCASSDAFVAFTDLTSSGTKMPRTSWSHMKTYDLAIADAPVRRAFSGLVGPMHQKVVSSVAENRTLAETRDYLLPRLMSGEVRVGEAGQSVSA
jgi:type I restriction enzyme S subunit